MDKKIIQKRVSDLWDDTVMIGQQIMLMSQAKQYDNREAFQNIVSEAALRSELMTCRMRHLLYEYTGMRKQNYLKEAADMQGMIIREYPDMLEIEVPCLFPKMQNCYQFRKRWTVSAEQEVYRVFFSYKITHSKKLNYTFCFLSSTTAILHFSTAHTSPYTAFISQPSARVTSAS